MAEEQDASESPRRSSRTGRPSCIHELDDWPNFRWDAESVAPSLTRANSMQAEVVAEVNLRNLTDSAVASSRIEGENPNPTAIRDFIARSVVGGNAFSQQERLRRTWCCRHHRRRDHRLHSASDPKRMKEGRRRLFPCAYWINEASSETTPPANDGPTRHSPRQ